MGHIPILSEGYVAGEFVELIERDADIHIYLIDKPIPIPDIRLQLNHHNEGVIISSFDHLEVIWIRNVIGQIWNISQDLFSK